MRVLSTLILLAAALFSNGTAYGQQDVMRFARESAKVAGSARFCNLDNVEIERFITRTLGNIALLSKDDTEKVIARLEFKNFLAASAATEPEEGCVKFAASFQEIIRAAQN